MRREDITALEAIKNQFAVEQGYGDWQSFAFVNNFDKHEIEEMVDTIAERFLKKQRHATYSGYRRGGLVHEGSCEPIIRHEEIKASIDKAAEEVRADFHNDRTEKLAAGYEAFKRVSVAMQKLMEATKPKPKITVAQAMETLTAELSKDKSEGSYYHGWQSNIALAIYDEFGPMNDDTYKEFIHKKANAAARRFLDSVLAPRCTRQVNTLRTSDGLLTQLIEILGCKHRTAEESEVLEEAKRYFRDKQNTEGRV